MSRSDILEYVYFFIFLDRVMTGDVRGQAWGHFWCSEKDLDLNLQTQISQWFLEFQAIFFTKP